MSLDSRERHRRSIRVRDYDYSQPGAYFVTVVTYHREALFGEINRGGFKPPSAMPAPRGSGAVEGEMRLSSLGLIAEEHWRAIPAHFPQVELGTYVVMPNHVHGIIVLTDRRGGVPPPLGAGTAPLRAPTLGQIVAFYKYQSTKAMNALEGTDTITRFWQRNYHERIIRDEAERDRIHGYIEANVANWETDEENPSPAG
jgi:putative transposase